MIEMTIDGRTIRTVPGKTVMELALENGIDIPRLCYHPELSVAGGCRLCLVEIEGDAAPRASCGLACQDGMNVRTQSARLSDLRREVLELLTHRHPLDCMVCEKSGACLLQQYAYEYGLQPGAYEASEYRSRRFEDNPFFVRDMQYCILCGRCVRACSEVVGAKAIAVTGRGYESRIATAMDLPLAETSCVFCGSCVQVCPTAALMPVSRKGKGREWEMERVTTICGYCGVGCEVEFAKRGDDIIYAGSRADSPVNGEFLCTKGRYGWDFSKNKERLASPMIRKDLAYRMGLTDEPWSLPDESPLAIEKPKIEDHFIPVGWETALDYVSGKLAETVTKYGPDSVMGLSSARCTNEENYLFQKFFRASIKTNNIDHCARL